VATPDNDAFERNPPVARGATHQPADLEERQQQIHDAEDAIVEAKEEEELGEAV